MYAAGDQSHFWQLQHTSDSHQVASSQPSPVCCLPDVEQHFSQRTWVAARLNVRLYIYKLSNVIVLNLAKMPRSPRSIRLLTPMTNILKTSFHSPLPLKAWWACWLGCQLSIHRPFSLLRFLIACFATMELGPVNIPPLPNDMIWRLLAEGPGGTLEEGGVCLPGTHMLFSAGFFNTWFPWHPAAAVHCGQQESPQQPHRVVLLMQHSQRMASSKPPRQLLPVQKGQIPRVLLAWFPEFCSAAHRTIAAPHPTGYGSQLCWGEFVRGGGCS